MKPKKTKPSTHCIPIILASESTYKKQLLERLKIPFSCHAPYIDESIKESEPPNFASGRLAKMKATSISEHYQSQNTLIIGCDQVAFINDDKKFPYLGKPGTLEKAKEQLQRSSGQIVSFYTSFYIHQTLNDSFSCHTDLTKVHYRTLASTEIDDYLDKEEVLNCAGSAKVEGLGISLLEKVINEDPTALIGLPLIALNQSIRECLSN